MPQYSGMWTLSQVSQAVKNQTWVGLPPSVIEYLVVAGGGSGGGDRGGGGGAGGLLTGYVGITPGTSYTVTVGAGATYPTPGSYVQGGNGSNSIFRDPVSVHVQAVGGGGGGTGAGGGNAGTNGSAGGSGGGATGNTGGIKGGGAGISGQGNAGGSSHSASYINAQGGGGAGLPGEPGRGNTYGTNGGSGIASDISGTRRVYAGGGGGGGWGGPNISGKGGVGGGGNGGEGGTGSLLLKGAVNSGGGGGGSSNQTQPYDGGSGGSGIVVIRYPGTTQFFTGGTLSYANGYVSHTFYANGTLAPTAPTKYVDPDYQISRSLRFNSADSPHLSRTPASTSSQTTATFSAWIKRSQLGTFGDCRIFTESTGSGTGLFWIQMVSDKIGVYVNGNGDGITSTQVFRDPSAWYHIVVAVDTTQVTSTDRIKVYVNGSQITAFTGTQTYYSLNETLKFNVTTSTNHIGYVNSQTFDGYMADINWIDGQALTPSSFGWTNPVTGVWAPIKYVGTYGTNGFYLNFSDNSNTTAGTLGADSSGNGNNFTPNNFSVTAGAGNDSLVDTPTSYGTDTGVGGEVRGNYATFSPLYLNGGGVTSSSYTNGNLQIDFSSSGGGHGSSTISVSSGKWYSEFTLTAAGGTSFPSVGIRLASAVNDSTYAPGYTTGSYGYSNDGNKTSSGTVTAYGATFTVGDVIAVALDLDAGTLVFYKNGVSQGTAYTGISGTFLIAVGDGSTAGTHTFVANFGQRPFAYTAPSGYKALCSTNLPTPTIGATAATLASEYFDTSIWAGNGDNVVPRIIPSNVDLANGGGLIWIKGRDLAVSHYLVDSVRGYTKYLAADTAAIDDTYNAGVAGTTNGFTFTGSSGTFNQLPYNYVGWQWKAGGTAVTNTSGSITSTVSASPASGFSVVTYTGNGTAGATIGHGLNAVPQMILVKNRSTATSWRLYHVAIGNVDTIFLDTDAAIRSDINPWNSTTPTSTVITLGSSAGQNESGSTFVGYCFAPVEGYSAFGSYTGNGNASGPFVYLGFRPAFLLIRSTGNLAGYHWYMFDNKRDPYNVSQNPLGAAANSAEPASASGYRELDMLSNGFKIRADGDQINYSTQKYIYMAFASNPFKYSLAR